MTYSDAARHSGMLLRSFSPKWDKRVSSDRTGCQPEEATVAASFHSEPTDREERILQGGGHSRLVVLAAEKLRQLLT